MLATLLALFTKQFIKPWIKVSLIAFTKAHLNIDFKCANLKFDQYSTTEIYFTRVIQMFRRSAKKKVWIEFPFMVFINGISISTFLQILFRNFLTLVEALLISIVLNKIFTCMISMSTQILKTLINWSFIQETKNGSFNDELLPVGLKINFTCVELNLCFRVFQDFILHVWF